MKTVLISGATGLIGKPISKKLEEKGYEVRKLSRIKKTWTIPLGS
ncbi:NAD-dependent epimerase/dehydratase family protein [Moheibacter lacus]|uniref:NAD(P)-dependent oxidoreductase n=1 Tax=Moheibacter lacus TaxID=2745851 RepID=A0A838ZRX6_9FLAO|nr:NAD(P)-dependent oxidoreductase [Moheibacter lacus]